jgi:hypothetical protein
MMKSNENQPISPAKDEQAEQPDNAEPAPAQPVQKPLDSKAEARRRSKEDLDRKRRNLRKGHGRF